MLQQKKKTYCPFLWSDVFIGPKGDVFCCCLQKPLLAGNILDEKLKDIYSNSKMQQQRQKSIDGNLECYERCTLIDKKKKHKVRKTSAFDYAADIKTLKVVFGELCNINCTMCRQDHKSKQVLDLKKLIENVDIEPIQYVFIQGGEPLAIAEAKAYYDYVAYKKRTLFLLPMGF